MSVENVRAAIESFLKNSNPKVLCIRGAWGTGKTYTWDEVLTSVASRQKIAYPTYSKVSLFGLNSIQEIKREIVSATRPVERIGQPFDFTKLQDLLTKAKTGPWTKIMDLIDSDATNAAVAFAAHLTRNQLVCFDDLERKGQDLRISDVLGYISHLRDEKECSVAILLNEEELDDHKKFESYLEKTVDIYLKFDPSDKEIADIAIPSSTSKIHNLVKCNSKNLGIKNVRVIRKILELVLNLHPLIEKYDISVLENCASTITLFGWSYLQPEIAPPLEYLTNLNIYSSIKDNSELDIKWRDTLRNYGYLYTDGFDLELLNGVRNGYFQQDEIDRHAKVLHKGNEISRLAKELGDTWEGMLYNFHTPQISFLNKFYDIYVKNISNISLRQMSELEQLFREAQDPRSDGLVDLYIETNMEVEGAFDLSNLYQNSSHNPEVCRRLEAAANKRTIQLDSGDILSKLHDNGFNQEIQRLAAALPVSEYKRIFLTYDGRLLSNIFSGIRQYLNISNNSISAISIITKAAEALREIEKEGGYNVNRVRRLGILQWLEEEEKKPSTI